MELGTHQTDTGVWWEQGAVGLMGSSELGREYGPLWFVLKELIILECGHRYRDLHPIDFAPITELSGAVLCWTAWSTQLTGGITLLYHLILSFIVCFFLGLDV